MSWSEGPLGLLRDFCGTDRVGVHPIAPSLCFSFLSILFSFIGLCVLGPRGPRPLAVSLPPSYKSWGYRLVPHTRLYVPCFKDTDNIWCPEGATAL